MELLSVGLLSQVGTVRTAREIVQLLGNLPAPLVVVYPRRMARVLPRKRFVSRPNSTVRWSSHACCACERLGESGRLSVRTEQAEVTCAHQPGVEGV